MFAKMLSVFATGGISDEPVVAAVSPTDKHSGDVAQSVGAMDIPVALLTTDTDTDQNLRGLRRENRSIAHTTCTSLCC